MKKKKSKNRGIEFDIEKIVSSDDNGFRESLIEKNRKNKEYDNQAEKMKNDILEIRQKYKNQIENEI